jgi:predicted nucleotidyltransferase
MRITQDEKKVLIQAVQNLDRNAKIWLFGSRVDDTKKGGDIDIAILSDKIGRLDRIKIRQDIIALLGEQKLDIVVSSDGRDPFFRLAIENGVCIMGDTALEVLKNNISRLESSRTWLHRSYECCKLIGIKLDYTEAEFDSFENLTSRYARTTDLLIHKVLRSIDMVEFMDSGSVIDTVNRAEKRGIIDSIGELRTLKDVRNEIAHEYETDDLQRLFSMVLDMTPQLFGIISRTISYSQRYMA